MKASLHTIRCERFEMDYAVFGSGPQPMVILPGLSLHPVTQSAASVAAAFSGFAGRCTIYLFDRKKDMQPGYKVVDMAEDTAGAMRLLGIRNAFVYGASQGGMMAMTIAARHPDLVAALALASTSARPGKLGADTIHRWSELAASGDAAALNRDIFSKVYSPEFYQKHRRAFAVIENQGTPEEMRSFRISADAAVGFDIWDELDAIKCPVFVTGVENDTVLGGQGARDIAQRLGCRLYMYPGSGHAAYDEDRRFPELLLDFMKDSLDCITPRRYAK